MYHLMYHSRSALPADGTPVGELGMLLEQCLAANPAQCITGVLAFHEGRFLQVIEGPEAAVDRLYAAICRDRRHGRIELVLHEPSERRCFASWSMAFACSDPRLRCVFDRVIDRRPPRDEAWSVVGALADIIA